MKLRIQTLARLVLVPTAILALAGCSSEPKKESTNMGAAETASSTGQGSTSVSVRSGVPGGMAVSTYQQTAKVIGIDRAARKITLLSPDGTKTTVKAGPEVANFDQIEVGDRVVATVTEQLVVFVRDSNEPPQQGQSTTIATAPLGAKPGAVVADTVEMTAKVTAIDLEHHTATVQFPDGQLKTFRVRDDVDLTKRSVGEEVVIRSTESVALRVEKS